VPLSFLGYRPRNARIGALAPPILAYPFGPAPKFIAPPLELVATALERVAATPQVSEHPTRSLGQPVHPTGTRSWAWIESAPSLAASA
jgi:hypothetical protein